MNCAQECSADQIPLRGQRTSSPWGWGCSRGPPESGERCPGPSGTTQGCAFHSPRGARGPGPVFVSPETLVIPTGAPPPSRALGAAEGKHLAEETVLTRAGCAWSPRPLPRPPPFGSAGPPEPPGGGPGGAQRATLALCYQLGEERTSATCSRSGRDGGARPTPFAPPPESPALPRLPPPRGRGPPLASLRNRLLRRNPPLSGTCCLVLSLAGTARPTSPKPDCTFPPEFRPPALPTPVA